MRITNKDLELSVKRLNELTGSPIETYTRTKQRASANIGNFHISGAYGGVSLHRVVNSSGGVDDVFRCGHVTKRDLYQRIHAMIEGIRLSN